MISLSSRHSYAQSGISQERVLDSDSDSVAGLSHVLNDDHAEQLHLGDFNNIRNVAETPDTLCFRFVGTSLKQKIAMGAAVSVSLLGTVSSGFIGTFVAMALSDAEVIASDSTSKGLISAAICTSGTALSILPLLCLALYRDRVETQVTRREGDMVQLISLNENENVAAQNGGFVNTAVEDV